MNPPYIGTWRITEMEGWDTVYIDLTGPGYVAFERKGSGFMQYGAVEGDLDYRVEETGGQQRLEFSFQGFDEGDPISGRGWAVVEGTMMTGRIYVHRGDEAPFKAVRTSPAKVRRVSTPKVIRLPKRPGTRKVCPFAESRTRQKIRYGQLVEIHFSKTEKALLEEHTVVNSEYTDRLESCDSGKTWTGTYNLDDLEDLLGYLGAGESHAEDKKIARRLGSLIRRVNQVLDSYDDGG